MPIFEYQCEQCGNRFEKLIRNQQDTPQSCPACQHESLRKMLSSFSPAVSQTPSPCDSGQCPSIQNGGCAGGTCPF